MLLALVYCSDLAGGKIMRKASDAYGSSPSICGAYSAPAFKGDSLSLRARTPPQKWHFFGEDGHQRLEFVLFSCRELAAPSKLLISDVLRILYALTISFPYQNKHPL